MKIKRKYAHSGLGEILLYKHRPVMLDLDENEGFSAFHKFKLFPNPLISMERLEAKC